MCVGGVAQGKEGDHRPIITDGQATGCKKRALDLFSGSKSVSNRLRELGYEVVSLDINPRYKPDICVDILQWQYAKMYPKVILTSFVRVFLAKCIALQGPLALGTWRKRISVYKKHYKLSAILTHQFDGLKIPVLGNYGRNHSCKEYHFLMVTIVNFLIVVI